MAAVKECFLFRCLRPRDVHLVQLKRASIESRGYTRPSAWVEKGFERESSAGGKGLFRSTRLLPPNRVLSLDSPFVQVPIRKSLHIFLSFRMAFFDLVTTGWIFDISTIQPIKYLVVCILSSVFNTSTVLT